MIKRSVFILAIGTMLMGTVGCNGPSNDLADPISENMPRPNHPPGKVSPPDFAAAAQKLGVQKLALVKALGLPDKPPTNQKGDIPPPRLDIKGAAIKLGISEEKLIAALNLPKPPKGDRLPPNAPPKP
jgi:hypothetical protein